MKVKDRVKHKRTGQTGTVQSTTKPGRCTLLVQWDGGGGILRPASVDDVEPLPPATPATPEA